MRILIACAVCVAVQTVAAVSASPVIGPDPYINEQWGLRMIGARAAWQGSTGTGVKVAVLDTGIDLGHPDRTGFR